MIEYVDLYGKAKVISIQRVNSGYWQFKANKAKVEKDCRYHSLPIAAIYEHSVSFE